MAARALLEQGVTGCASVGLASAEFLTVQGLLLRVTWHIYRLGVMSTGSVSVAQRSAVRPPKANRDL